MVSVLAGSIKPAVHEEISRSMCAATRSGICMGNDTTENKNQKSLSITVHRKSQHFLGSAFASAVRLGQHGRRVHFTAVTQGSDE
jgi:hypothetical protein